MMVATDCIASQLLWAGVLVPYDTLDAVRRHSTLMASAVLLIISL